MALSSLGIAAGAFIFGASPKLWPMYRSSASEYLCFRGSENLLRTPSRTPLCDGLCRCFGQ
eukprot:2159774-Rhodomonas_salina.1